LKRFCPPQLFSTQICCTTTSYALLRGETWARIVFHA
jgi:hypothetical protein